MRSLGAIAAALLCTGLIAGDAEAQRGDRDRKWVNLGCKEVDLLGDRDVLRVGRHEGRFKAIRLEAKGNDVEMIDLKVYYANGDFAGLDLYSTFTPDIKNHLTYVVVEDQLAGGNRAAATARTSRGEDYAFIISPEFTPM